MTESEQQQIFREWLSGYRALLFKIIKAYAFNAENQNDLFQDVCMQVYRVAYVVPLAVVCISALIIREATWEKWLIVKGALLLSIFVLRWEQRAYNMPGKNHLLKLKKRLTEE